MRKRLIVTILSVIGCCFILAFSASAASKSAVKILLNSEAVTFTNDTGYPYVDENNRTMVPLRVTMESAGFVVGYDANADTAIVITERSRIEVPIGTNKIYTDNKLTENDTAAVVNNGRTYLPIRAVLENAGYTVEWADNTNTVNAYTFKYDANELVPYSTSDPSTLLENILNGNVVYVQGQYYATPDYVKRMTNVQMHYWGSDLNTAKYPEEKPSNHYDYDESKIEWVSGINFDYMLVKNSRLEELGIVGEQSEIPNFSYAYALYKQVDEVLYCFDEITDEFMNASDATGTFNGIRMKKIDGILYFNYPDLKAKNIYSR